MTINDDTTRSTHPVYVGHLVMGLAFLGLVGVWAAVQYGGVSSEDLRWLLPLPWVFAGAAGLLAVTLSGRRPVPAAVDAGSYRYQPAYDETPADTDHGAELGTDNDTDPSEENR